MLHADVLNGGEVLAADEYVVTRTLLWLTEHQGDRTRARPRPRRRGGGPRARQPRKASPEGHDKPATGTQGESKPRGQPKETKKLNASQGTTHAAQREQHTQHNSAHRNRQRQRPQGGPTGARTSATGRQPTKGSGPARKAHQGTQPTASPVRRRAVAKRGPAHPPPAPPAQTAHHHAQSPNQQPQENRKSEGPAGARPQNGINQLHA